MITSALTNFSGVNFASMIPDSVRQIASRLWNSTKAIAGFNSTTREASRSRAVSLAEPEDRPGEKCGVFGVFSLDNDKAHLGGELFNGLQPLQHRGQDAAGVAMFTPDHAEKIIPDELYHGTGKSPSINKINRFPYLQERSKGKIVDVFLRAEDEDGVPAKRLTEGFSKAEASHGIAHNLYTTNKAKKSNDGREVDAVDSSGDKPVPQPIVMNGSGRSPIQLAFAFNGNIDDLAPLRKFVQDNSNDLPFFQGFSNGDNPKNHVDAMNDSLLMASALFINYKKTGDLKQALNASKHLFRGAYSILLMDKENLAAFRGPFGVRPLSIASRSDKNGEKVYFSSETISWLPLKATHIRNLEPGEILVINKDTKLEDLAQAKPEDNAFQGMKHKKLRNLYPDLLEALYFRHAASAREHKTPDGTVQLVPYARIRRNFGKRLADNFNIRQSLVNPKWKAKNTKTFQALSSKDKEDFYVVPVLSSGKYAAEGFAKQLGMQVYSLLYRNDGSSRTFIDDGKGVDQKHIAIKDPDLVTDNKGNVPGSQDRKRDINFVLVDDSLIRGSTSRSIVKKMKEAYPHAKIHLAIAAPRFRFPNFNGVATGDQNTLLAHRLYKYEPETVRKMEQLEKAIKGLQKSGNPNEVSAKQEELQNLIVNKEKSEFIEAKSTQKSDLEQADRDLDQRIADYLGCESVTFLSREDFNNKYSDEQSDHGMEFEMSHCDGVYPVPLSKERFDKIEESGVAGEPQALFEKDEYKLPQAA